MLLLVVGVGVGVVGLVVLVGVVGVGVVVCRVFLEVLVMVLISFGLIWVNRGVYMVMVWVISGEVILV